MYTGRNGNVFPPILVDNMVKKYKDFHPVIHPLVQMTER